MIDIPTPCKNEVEKYLKKWDSLENYVLQEKSLDKLFFITYPNNNEIEDILIKVSSLNDFYSTNIFSVFPVAKHILNLDIDNRLKSNDETLVNDIANLSINGKKKCFYSFATKYCCFFYSTTNPPFIHYASSALVFFCGNLLIFILGIIKKRPFFTYMSGISVGTAAIAFLLPHRFYGLAERMGIYSLIIFEFIIGLEMLKINRNKYLENA